jgi:predicted Fe-Mo cluster-binding NifX family protein
MRIGLPTEGDNGLAEPVHGRFGRAPGFTIVDTGDGSVKTVAPCLPHQVPGECDLFTALAGENLDVVVVRHIGWRAVANLAEMGVLIFESPPEATVGQAVAALQAGRLPVVGVPSAWTGSPFVH